MKQAIRKAGLLALAAIVCALITSATAFGAIGIDQTVFKDQGPASTTVAAGPFSTASANELLLAFVSTDAGSGTNTTVTGVSGAGLTWVLVRRTNTQRGTSEIWRAFAPSALTNVTVTATLSLSMSSMMTVMSFTGVDSTGTSGSGAIGATGTGNSTAGAPTASLVTTRNNSWVLGVGNDYDKAVSRTPGTNQTVVHQFLSPVGDTYWVQRQNATTALSGTSVAINDTAPAGDRYNLSIVEILPSQSTAPDLTITKSHTGNFVQGRAGTTYTITATNSGGAATSGAVTVVDTLPAGLTQTAMSGTGWTCTLATLTCTRNDALAAAASYPAITLTVNVAGNALASVTNTATVSGGGETNTSNDMASNPTTINTPPDLTISKSHTGTFVQGQTGAIYTITVTNSGGSTTTGTVTMSDTLPTGLTSSAMTGTGWSCILATLTCTRGDALAAAASYPAITLTVNVAGNALAAVTNTATVSGGGEANSSNDTASDVTTITVPSAPPDLTISKSHTGNFAQGQTGATYTITVTNSGGSSTSGTVIVTDTLPAGLTQTAMTGTGWTCTLATLTCTRSTVLAAAASYPAITLTVNVAGNALSSVTNSVTVSGGGETNTSNDAASDITTITAVAPPDLTISKSHTGNFVQGQTGATYTITVSNSGGSSTAGTVTMSDTLPAGLTSTALSGTGWTCTLQTLICTRSTMLAAGASYPAITLTVNVAGNALSSVTNSVTVSGGGQTDTSNDSATDATTIAAASTLITHVGGASIHPNVTNQTFAINYTPVATNDAVVVLAGCISPGITSMTLAAPGWTFTPISGLVGPSGISDFIGTFGAIVPNTAPVTFTVTLTGGNGTCGGDATILVDEFSGADTTGGATTFEAHNESLDNNTVTGICTGAPLTPVSSNDAIWYACYDNVTGVTGSYSKGQDDGIGDWTEYKVLSGGAGVVQNPGFTTDPRFSTFAMGGVAIRAKAAVSSVPDMTISKTHTGNFTQGQTGTAYAITVTNSGGASTSGTVTVSDTLPAGLTATAISGTGWSCTLATLTCTRSTVLAAAATYPTITLTVNVAGNALSSVTNSVTVSGGGETNTVNDTANDITTILAANATISLVQQNVNGNEGGTNNMSVSFPANNTAGNFLIVTGTAARPASTISVSDTLGNSYLTAIGPVTDPNQDVTMYVWYVPVCKGGSNTVTITPSGTAALEIHVSEWTGLATSSPVDQTTFDTGNGTAVSSGAKITTLNGELIFGYGWVFNNASAGAGFTSLSLVNGDLDEYQIQNSAGSVAATFTQASGGWVALMVTFKPATSVTSPVLSVSPQNIPFAATVGGSNPAPATINVTNIGVGTLTFSAASDSPSWLSVSPAGGTAPQSLQATASVSGLSVGTYTGHITVTSSGVQGSPAVVNVTLTVGAISSAITIDATAFGDRGTAATSVTTSPAFSTTSGNELLLAMIGTDVSTASGTNNSITSVTGGGLTWALVRRTNTQRGTAEIWRAFATAPLSNVTVTANLAISAVSSITVMSFRGVNTSGTNGSGAIGNTGSGNGTTGSPTASLVTTANNSLVVGAGEDWNAAPSVTAGSNQTIAHQVAYPNLATFWSQRQNSTTPASGTTVTINDTAPTNHVYNLTIVEILPGTGGGAGGGTAPTITTQPANQTVGEGQAATFMVAAAGTAPLSYQWRKGGTNINGAISSSYTTPATVSADSGATFDVVVTNSVSSVTSGSATLTVTTAPTIVTPPTNQTVTVGQTATFTVVAAGTPPLNYQWRKGGTNINGATSSSYTTPATVLADSGATFDVVATNSVSNVTSSSATLTVQVSTAPPLLTFAPNPVTGLASPLGFEIPGDSTNRIFIVQQNGTIRIIQNGVLAAGSFLDITTGKQLATGGDLGLLGLAFHPNFSTNRKFYVYYMRRPNTLQSVIAEYQVSLANPNQADLTSERILLVFDQPFENHKGGQLAFGQDGFLYIASGDGGSENDPLGNGQNTNSLLGKMLRIDVDSAFAPGKQYAIPPDNPFVSGGGLPEIYAYGLRNPWRFSFDRGTGRLFAGDVGQDAREEVDIVTNGGNFGWSITEGTICRPPTTGCNMTGMVPPIAEYDHSAAGGISIIGGFVYRGTAIPGLVGTYVFTDLSSGHLWGIKQDAGGVWQRTVLLNHTRTVSAMGQDAAGELYVVDYVNGSILHLIVAP